MGSEGPQKKVLVKTQEYLPRNPRFVIEVHKSQSQGCRAKFSYRVKIAGPMEFWLTVTRTDLQQGWEHDLHVRWQASGDTPALVVEDGCEFDNEVAQMVAMGYDIEKAKQALHMKGGDLGAAASFIGACDVADEMSVEDAHARRAEANSLRDVESASSGTGVVEEPLPYELPSIGENVVVNAADETDGHSSSSSSSQAQLPPEPIRATALATNETLLEQEPLADWCAVKA